MGAVLGIRDRISMTNGTVFEDSDARLMLRFKDGDAGAFELLFSRHLRAIVNFCYRFVRNRQIAEELAQEIFLKVYTGASGYEAQAKFTTWLYRIATNVCLNEIRKSQFRATHEPLREALPANAGNATVACLNQQAIARAIRKAMEQLPVKQRAAFILNKYQELSYAEVSEIMGVSEQAVKSLIHRAKETLAEVLKPSLQELCDL
ncbi:MAG: RNA polymerase sigma factor [Acidobacteriota bacterium]|nr:RNA polymerase sigma factor [Acidobacteriota bacterium]